MWGTTEKAYHGQIRRYHELEGVHNGGEAMSIFPEIQYMQPEEQERARRNLLAYLRDKDIERYRTLIARLGLRK